MAREHTTSKSLIPIAGAVVAVGLVVLFGRLDEPASRLMTSLLGAAARAALELLLSVVPAAWRALQSYAFDHQGSSSCPLQIVTTVWSVLHVMAAAA